MATASWNKSFKSRGEARESPCPADGALQGGSHRWRILSPKLNSRQARSRLQSHREVIAGITRARTHLASNALLGLRSNSLCLKPTSLCLKPTCALCGSSSVGDSVSLITTAFVTNMSGCCCLASCIAIARACRGNTASTFTQRSHTFVFSHSSHLVLVHIIVPCYYNPFLNPSL